MPCMPEIKGFIVLWDPPNSKSYKSMNQNLKGKKNKTFFCSMSMSKKHFQLDYTISSCLAIFYLCAKWKNVLGNVLVVNYNSVLENYFLYQPQLFRHILECSLGVQGIPTMVPWGPTLTLRKNCKLITKASGTGTGACSFFL